MAHPDPRSLTGTITTLMSAKGYGFIFARDGRQYFFHRSNAIDFDELQPQMIVRFRPIESAKGPRAEYVERL
jgi:cold shock CspA family protein